MQNNIKKNGTAGASNTPAENTTKNSQNACIDWLTCSFIFACDVQQIFYLLGIDDLSLLEEVEGSRYEFAGYDTTYKLGRIELLHYFDDFNQVDNWLLNLSGQACRDFEIMSSLNFRDLFIVLSNVNAVYTRLDIAIDDYTNTINVNKVRKAVVYDKTCVTQLRSWGDHKRGLISDDTLIMDNFYIGSRSSRYFLNVYDKKLEQLEKNKKVNVKSWTRVELRLSYDYADLFVLSIINSNDDLGYMLKSFLNDKIVFLSPSSLKKDSNKSRLAKDVKNHARWWRKFLNTTSRLHLSSYRGDKTLKDTMNWHIKQVSTSLAMLSLYKKNNYDDYIKKLTEIGKTKLQNKHIRKVLNQQFIDKLKNKKKDLKKPSNR